MAIKKVSHNEFVIKKQAHQSNLKASTEFLLSPSSLGASATKHLLNKGNALIEDIGLQATKEVLEEIFSRIKNNDLQDLEEILFAQAFALNSAFTNLVARADRQQDASTMQMLINLSFKAQNQCRTTIDSLRELKRPNQKTFVRQANITQGYQQVNTSLENAKSSQNELLRNCNAELDNRTTPTTKHPNKTLEAMGKINRSKNSRGEK